jgi:plastocyanin
MKGIIAVFVVAIVALVGCSSGFDEMPAADRQANASEQPPFELNAAPVDTTEVNAVKSNKFDPEVIQLSVGSEVTWTNEDVFPHNVRFLDGSDTTYDLPIGETASITFDETGDFYYDGSLHPQTMRAKVIVTE